MGKKLNPHCVYFSIITVFSGAGAELMECLIWHRQEVHKPDSCQCCASFIWCILHGSGSGSVSSCAGLGAFTVLITLRGYQKCLSEGISSVLALHHHGLPSRQSFKFSTLPPNLGVFLCHCACLVGKPDRNEVLQSLTSKCRKIAAGLWDLRARGSLVWGFFLLLFLKFTFEETMMCPVQAQVLCSHQTPTCAQQLSSLCGDSCLLSVGFLVGAGS